MVGGVVGTAICATIAAVLFTVGVFQLSVCGSGLSLILFGVTIFIVGLAIYPAGGPVLFGASGLMMFLLGVVGIILAHGAGCAY